MAEVGVNEGDASTAQSSGKKQTESREIPGNLAYTSSHGALKTALEGIISAERPDKFSGDFLSTVLKVTGGSARPIPPILKRMGLLSSDGSPTELYSRFKSDAGRSSAALEGLRRAFAEIFRRNEFAYKLDNDGVRSLIVEITGLNKTDGVVRAMLNTFTTIRSFIGSNVSDEPEKRLEKSIPELEEETPRRPLKSGLGLAYNINLILPETSNVQVFNAIFKSLKQNLLSDE